MKNTVPGTLYIIAAPSGGGKTSLVDRLVKSLDQIEVSISHTTRKKRSGEIHGINYYFIDQKTFEEMRQQEIFLEHATVYGESYGTSRDWVLNKLKNGIDIILEIDWQGARQIKKIISDCVSIFILPPALSILHQRLISRGQDDPEIIEKRMQQAKNEIRHCYEFDYLIINETFEITVDNLMHIIHANRLLQRKQSLRYLKLLNELTT